jgi:diguanylate cyclase (GGDEF)-like protein
MHDSLTGLLNRPAILERLEQELSRCRRTGSSLAAVMIDVDHFKHVNDTLGHAAGDVVLSGVADRLRTGVRAYDSVARFGGEEFLVALPDCTAEQAERVAERARKNLAQGPIPVGDRGLKVTASFGVAATAQPEISDIASLLRAADLAMYRAKAGGRNRVAIFDTSSDAELAPANSG